MRTIIYENNKQINSSKTLCRPFHYSGTLNHIPFLLDGVGLLDCLGDYHLKRREEDGYILIYIYEGKMDLLYDGTNYLLRKNDMVLLDFTKYHEFFSESKKSFRYFFINICQSDVISAIYSNIYDNGFTPVNCSTPEDAENCFNTLLSLAEVHSPDRYMTTHSITYTLLSYISRDLFYLGSLRQNPYTPKWCSVVLAHISENYAQKINFTQFAEKYNMSPQQFSNSFKKIMDVSPHNFLTETRLFHAKILLQHTDKNLEIIAYETGFSNTSRFIKAFEKQNGLTPARFRKSQQKNSRKFKK